MDQSGELDAEMREMVRGEQKDLVVKQLVLEAAITTMLLPSDPNDDRYVLSINICVHCSVNVYSCINGWINNGVPPLHILFIAAMLLLQ